jgi:hypothetical protein
VNQSLVFSVILFLLLVTTCLCLLLKGKLSGKTFVFSLLVCAVTVAVIHNLDVVQHLQLKGASIEATADFERIRVDVYAKATQVRLLSEQVSELIAENVATSNRYGGSGPDHADQEMRYRNKIRQTLIDAGTPKERREEILAPFAKWIPFDLRDAIGTAGQDLQRQKGWTPRQMNEFTAKFLAIFAEKQSIAELDRAVQLLQQSGLSSPKLEESVNRYRTFLTEDRLPPLNAAPQ